MESISSDKIAQLRRQIQLQEEAEAKGEQLVYFVISVIKSFCNLHRMQKPIAEPWVITNTSKRPKLNYQLINLQEPKDLFEVQAILPFQTASIISQVLICSFC